MSGKIDIKETVWKHIISEIIQNVPWCLYQCIKNCLLFYSEYVLTKQVISYTSHLLNKKTVDQTRSVERVEERHNTEIKHRISKL